MLRIGDSVSERSIPAIGKTNRETHDDEFSYQDEIEIQSALNKIMADAEFDDVDIEIRSDGGPSDPNCFIVVHSGYSPPEERVREALASIPGVSPDPIELQPVGIPGYLSSSGEFTPAENGILDSTKANEFGARGYMDYDMKFSPQGSEPSILPTSVTVDLHQIPALASLVQRLNIDKVHIYLSQNIIDGW